MNPVNYVTGWKYRADKHNDFTLGCVVKETMFVNSLQVIYGHQEMPEEVE